MATTYDIGDRVHLTASFTDNAGAAADPTAVSLKIKNPAGTVTTYTYAGGAITKDSTGEYHMDYTIPSDAASVGGWLARFEGTGSVVAAEETAFSVRASGFYS